jgi:DNA-binding transcriptional LysR family regulator
MTTLARYAAGYVLDFFRERVTRSDLASWGLKRVMLAPGFTDEETAALRALLPQVSMDTLQSEMSLRGIRRERLDAVLIPMSGGGIRERARALFSGARHRLLVPSPDYLYRFGIRRGAGPLLWAVVDRFLFAPAALLWLGFISLSMWLSGLIGRSIAAERSPTRPKPSQ